MSVERLRKIATIATVACLAAASLAVGYHVTTMHWPGASARNRGTTVLPSRIAATDQYGRSAEIDLVGRPTPALFLVLDVSCSVCAENLPRWVQLVGDEGSQLDVEVFVLSLSRPQETLSYVSDAGLAVPKSAIRFVQPRGLLPMQVHSVPSTVTFQPSPRALTVWSGLLHEEDIVGIIQLLAN